MHTARKFRLRRFTISRKERLKDAELLAEKAAHEKTKAKLDALETFLAHLGFSLSAVRANIKAGD